MKAEDVNFIVGSDVYGPMGMELIPVRGKKETEAFMKDHKGKRMLSFDEIKPVDIPGMTVIRHPGHEKGKQGEMKDRGM